MNQTLVKIFQPAVKNCGLFQLPELYLFLDKCIDDSSQLAETIWDQMRSDFKFVTSETAEKLFLKHSAFFRSQTSECLRERLKPGSYDGSEDILHVIAHSRKLFSSAIKLLMSNLIEVDFDPWLLSGCRKLISAILKLSDFPPSLYPLDLQALVCHLELRSPGENVTASALLLTSSQEGRYKLKTLLLLCYPDQLASLIHESQALQNSICPTSHICDAASVTSAMLFNNLKKT